jgi:hypothetical protein
MVDATLVTVHGFWSSPSTWDRLRAVWQADDELEGLQIHGFGYPSPRRRPLPFSWTRVPDLDDLAQMLASEYATVLGRASSIAFVTHSQGGLILQRFLAWMVSEGRAQELARIRTVIMLACPNSGSQYLASIRRALGYGRHPQAGDLEVLSKQVTDTQRAVLARIVNASGVNDHQCRIPFHVYAAGSDAIVPAASAQAAFPGASTLAGNHFTILDPAASGNRTADIVKHHILTDLTEQPAASAHGASPTPPAPPADVRLMPEWDAATNHFRLGALNRGGLGRFRVEVIDAHNQDGNWVGPRRWPVPWLEDGSVTSKEIPKFGRPLLDFAYFDLFALKEDLEGTKWLRGDHWVFPSLPQPVRFRYSAVRAWPDLNRQYIVITLRVIRDEPDGYVDIQFKIGTDGTQPYCRELSEKSASDVSPLADPRQLRDPAVGGRLKQPDAAESESAPAPEPTPVVTDRWRHTSDGAKVPSLMRLTHTGLFHPGYSGRQSHDEPPSIKIGILVACRPIDPASSGSALRAKFLSFLNSAAVRELIGALTHVVPDATWKNLAGHGPRTLEAALTTGENPLEGVPVASALFLPSAAGEGLYGREGRAATLILYIEPRTAAGLVPSASDLAAWHRRLSLALAVPGAFADFLSSDLGLGAFGDPPAQFGVWLKSHQPLTTMVDTQGLRTLPGSSPSNQFIGWAYADPDGNSIACTGRDLLTQLCEYELHLDAFEQTLDAING